MERMRLLGLWWLGAVSVVFSGAGEQFRTDINPALEYYQAFLLTPDLEQADREYIYANEVPDHRLPERFGELMGRYDPQFSLVRRAAHATVPCDWGVDLSNDPATMLPHLARAKAVVQTARLRAIWDLQQDRAGEACEDLVSALALARNLANQDIVISALVQIAMEAIVCTSVAENFGRYPEETLKRLIEGFDASPTRTTIAACIPSEKALFYDRTLNKILELRKQSPGDDAKVMEGIHQLLEPDRSNVDGVASADTTNEQRAVWERLSQAAKGSSEGILKLLQERGEFYDRMEVLMRLPYAEYQTRIQEFSKEIENATNALVSGSARSMLRFRAREFRILATLEMVRAAVEYTLHGEVGLKNVTDPCGKGPFGFRRFIFNGVDRGFELRSGFSLDGDDFIALIFVEKEGPAFRVTGKQIGTAVSKESAEDTLRRRYGLDGRK